MGTRMFALVKDMLKSVYNLNELGLSDMLEAAFEMYPMRVVCADIIAPMMWEIGSMWERGELMVVMEHFASNVVITKLKALLHKQNTTTNAKGPVVIVACAPNEVHEIGALIVSFFMSLNGWKVIYLGQNVPTSDLLNIVDTMDVHTIALSASTDKCLSALKAVGTHIASRSKRKKIEFLVGGRLLKMGDGNILETIPSATTRTADDLYAYCPPEHPTHQDTMVRGALDGSYSLIRESYRKMRLASERRKRTQYLLDQITDDSVGSTKDTEDDKFLEELGETLAKVAQIACAADGEDINYPGCGEDIPDSGRVEELPDSPAINNKDKNDNDDKDEAKKSPIITSSSEPVISSPKSPSKSKPTSKPSSMSASRSPKSNLRHTVSFPKYPTDSDPQSPELSDTKSPSISDTKSPSVSDTKSPSVSDLKSSSSLLSCFSPPSNKTTVDKDPDLKDRLEKQKQQTQAMREMLKKYKEGRKNTEDTIARSRAFLNENRLVAAKPKVKSTLDPTPFAAYPPARVVPSANVNENRLVGQRPPNVSSKAQLTKPATTFLHMHDPASGNLYNKGPAREEPYFPKYTNMPKLGDFKDNMSNGSSSSNGSCMSEDDFDDGIE